VSAETRRPPLAPAAVLPAAVVIGVCALVWAATTGPIGMLHESGRTFTFHPPKATVPAGTGTVGPTLHEVTKDVRPQFHLAWLGDLLVAAAFLAVGLLLLLLLRGAWRRRWHAPERPQEVDFEVMPDAVRDALRRDVATQLAAVDGGSPRNGIVACWLRLQEIVTAAGHPPHRAETSAEFVVRTLRALDLDPRAVGALAALYREARFSEHEVGEDARTAARSALQELHEDLRSRGTVP
jgi:Domain of unknown function (DUF4129)